MRAVLEIGGTHVTAALADPGSAEVTAHVSRRLDAQGSEEDILGSVISCAAGLPAPPGAVWGVAVPGPFDYARGIGLFEGVGKFDSLRGVDVRAALLDGLSGRPAGMVFLNDAHAFLLGEWHAGAAQGHGRCAGITLGTGVGSAFLADGSPQTGGPAVPPQGRADLLQSGGRPLEETVSRRAIRERYGEASLDVDGIASRARSGEDRARTVLDEAFTALGDVLAPYLTSFGASVLVVGGSMTGSWDLIGPALRAGLGDTPVTVRASRLTGDAALIGAAHAAVAT
ncbi:ROK family protein [Streptomyces abyssalis]|uniref:ROK family protein n=1 Tax=Streptomyces abyssalis TaxID=933944 RepID=A0A1E7JSK1_9ACTN|nr:ROK family protein [Streptomyces abyssalis]OEU91827.1 ROK family protein [Streptomyces abyssalis]OEU94033.1 ROK family protein [Streptomyces abyssalis]